MKTKAAVIYEHNRPFVIETLELEDPKEGEVLLRIVASGICHSDHHVITGNYETPLPMVLGHEGGAVVEALGPKVERVKVGDHCVATWMPACRRCYYCVEGMSYLCDRGKNLLMGTQPDGTFRFHKGSQDIGQMHFLGTFSEYVVVPEDSVVVIDRDLPLEKACITGCAVPTGFGSVTRRAQMRAGSTALIIGCGGVGVSAIQGARFSGARMVIAADIVDEKLRMLGPFGVTHTINNKKENLVQKVMEITQGVGVDYSFEAIGTPEAQHDAIEALRKGGICVLIGVTPFSHDKILTTPAILGLYSKSILGSLYGSSNTLTEIPHILQLYRDGRIKLNEMVTKEYRLEQVNEAFNDMLNGRNIRGVIRFD